MASDLHFNNSEVLICLNGRLDPDNSAQLREQFQALDTETVSKLTLDFSNVEYISAAGLRELIILKKRLGDKPVFIRNACRQVDETLKSAGYYKFFETEKSDIKCIADGYLYCRPDGNLPFQMSFRSFLSEKVLRGPKKTIVKANGNDYGWADIDRGARIIAKELHGQGVGKGTHVALCGANSINWILCFFAIQMLGGIALLLNSNLTAAEIVNLCKTGDATHFCYGEMPLMKDEKAFISAVLKESPVTSVCSIRNSRFVETKKDDEIPLVEIPEEIEKDDPCVMIFTSGSTGAPKGVLLSAYNILNASACDAISLRFTAKDRTCLILPMFHIFGLVAGFGANAVADATMIIPDSIRTANLIRTVSEEQCTVLHSVPTMFLSIVNNAEFEPEKMKSLRCTVLAGAAATEAQVRMLQGKFPGNHFASCYGLSEMAPVSRTDYEDTLDHISRSIGKPLPGVEVRIVDPYDNSECGTGTVGEIQVRGYNLMTCYYKASLEEQAIDEEGWLHTGDLGSIEEDGYMYFAGRIKELIKRGGESIIPKEVASAISENEAVSDVRVLGVPDAFWGETVAAAVIIKEGADFDAEQLREQLHKKLAKFKIPEYFICVDAFPMLSNGKVDAVRLKKEITEQVKALRDIK